jgi:hypothetical protein
MTYTRSITTVNLSWIAHLVHLLARSLLIGTISLAPASAAAQTEQVTPERAAEMAVDESGRVYWLRSVFGEGGELPELRSSSAGIVKTLMNRAQNVHGLYARVPYVFYLHEDRVISRFDQREVIAATDATLRRVRPVVDNGYVYWVSGTGIRRRQTDGRGMPIEIVTLQSPPIQLAVDGTHLYWLERYANGTSGIRRVALVGGAPEIVIGTSMSLTWIALDDQRIFFATSAADPMRFGGGVLVCDKGALVFRWRTLTPERRGGAVWGLVVDHDYVYWSDQVAVDRFALRRASKTARGYVTLAETAGAARDLSQTTYALYWAAKHWGVPLAETNGGSRCVAAVH